MLDSVLETVVGHSCHRKQSLKKLHLWKKKKRLHNFYTMLHMYLLPVGMHKCGRSSPQTSFWWPHSCWWTAYCYLQWHTHTDHVNAIRQISPTDHLRKWTRRLPWSTTKPDGVKPKNAAFPDTSCIKQRKSVTVLVCVLNNTCSFSEFRPQSSLWKTSDDTDLTRMWINSVHLQSLSLS